MSLDNTSRPGGPGHDELVPSRYALRVGEIDVLVVSDGVLSLPGAMLAHNADPAVRERCSCRWTCSSGRRTWSWCVAAVGPYYHSLCANRHERLQSGPSCASIEPVTLLSSPLLSS